MVHAKRALVPFTAVAVLVASSAVAPAQEPNTRVTVRPDGTPSIHGLVEITHPLSRDGRWALFITPATDLVPAKSSGNIDDVFVRDLDNGVTTLASLADDESLANSSSFSASISGDGRFVAFWSGADNLVSGDTNNAGDVFLRDRDPDGDGVYDEADATTILVSRRTDGSPAPNGASRPAVAADGSCVIFVSTSELDFVDRSGNQVWCWERATGAITCVSVTTAGADPGGMCEYPSVSDDGRYVAFESDANFPGSGDTNGDRDVYLRDRLLGVTELVSVRTDGTVGNDRSTEASISGDGRYVAFTSEADNFFIGDGNQDPDVFIRDRTTAKLANFSRTKSGTPFDQGSYSPRMSGDGKQVVFATDARNVSASDQNGRTDVVRVDVTTRDVALVSENCFGTSGSLRSVLPSCDATGERVSFFSEASDLDRFATGGRHLYVRDFAVPWPLASRATYDVGWPGTNGVPSFTASVDPQWGAAVDLDADNSSGAWNVGFLLLGDARANWPTNRGGSIVVDFFLMLPVVVAPWGWHDTADIPFDVALSGVAFDLQLIQFDPGASHGMSFTPGLELTIGR